VLHVCLCLGSCEDMGVVGMLQQWWLCYCAPWLDPGDHTLTTVLTVRCAQPDPSDVWNPRVRKIDSSSAAES
jgi:hypothetical protein